MPADLFAELLEETPPEKALAGAPARHRELFEQFENIRPFLKSRGGAPPRISQLFHYRTFDQFLATYLFTSYFVNDADQFGRLAGAVTRRLREQNIVYAEVTVSVVEYLDRGIALGDVAAVLHEQASRAEGVRVQWIVDLVRNSGPDRARELLARILDECPGTFAGITLGGNERLFPPALFAEVYRLAADRGLRLTVHAGEALGAESVWDSLRVLGAERIGHGVRAVEDPRLIEELRRRDIALEVCPTSNLCTGVYRSYGEHPLKALFDAGAPLTLSTDDPTFFHTTLAEEYEHAAEMGLPDEAILTLLENGFRYAFLPESESGPYIGEIGRRWRRFRRM